MGIASTSIHKEIYLAGGCFWGTEAFLKRLPGVISTEVGYANGDPLIKSPSYRAVCTGTTGYAETVHLIYDPREISLALIIQAYLCSIDPTSVNRQGGDLGPQYRTGIFWTDEQDKAVIEAQMYQLQRQLDIKHKGKVAIEVQPLHAFWPAEDYHQDYLDVNPGGYCHVNLNGAEAFVQAHAQDFAILAQNYNKPDEETLKANLDDLAFEVTQHAYTERPFSSPLDHEFKPGIYVDRTTGEPLFSSTDKFDSGCGWPAFSKPIATSVIQEYGDPSLPGRFRTEVKSARGNAHLGHVFHDGPTELGGERYCINGAALEFIPLADMDARGYGYLKSLVERQ
ncbi:peptide-methionine (R)-S-oxide reductase MsrB [Collinsella sp. zg1085]|uniref:peptide-methionine (R)-S-oxide reductase MsrB n=1 Tax=Collinsella sp. zg1085 TaxID=2844380 RepID=UPI001C0D44AB|nr:peptide-methionine (R)-S-oxide reductase MsrB [Collinsella sp. zg1085]QWT17835.1 peptide-methionine (R)-S-oxide reductase MsrB [Collinsella sp. zg1085]